MKKLITLVLSLLCIQLANAENIDGIQYILYPYNETAKVIYTTSGRPTTSNPSYPDFQDKELIIPETVNYGGTMYTVTSIGSYAFGCCKGLKTVSIPKTVTTIEEYAFSSSSLESVTFTEGLTKIGMFAFNACNITTLSFPKSLKTIGSQAFMTNSNLTSITFSEGLESIGEKAFMWCEQLTSVSLPESVISMSSSCFSSCWKLKSIKFPKNLTKIPESCFWNCYDLTDVTLPENVVSLGNSCFSGCTSLKSFTFKNSITEIGDKIFENCNTDLIISNFPTPNLASIGNGAFKGMTAIKTLIFPETLKSIGREAFDNCLNLTSVEFKSGDIQIEGGAFNNCVNVKEVRVPNLENWLTIKFGEYVTNSEDYTKHKNLISNPNYYANNLLINGEELSGVFLFPEEWTSVPNYILAGCKEITDVIIPQNVKTIGNCAFAGCNKIKTIVLPENTNEVNNFAFVNCEGLERIVSLNSTPPSLPYYNEYYSPSTEDLFLSEDVKLYVLESNIDTYKASIFGKNFAQILPFIKIQEMSINEKYNVLPVGYKKTLKIKYDPIDPTIPQLLWESSNPGVATIDYFTGEVNAISQGSTTITAKTTDGSFITSTYSLNVLDSPGKLIIEDFEINANEQLSLPINLVNNIGEDYAGVQFDVALPSSLQFESANLGEDLAGKGFNLNYNEMGGNTIRFVISPNQTVDAVGYTTNIMFINIKASSNASAGTETINVTSVSLATEDGRDAFLDDSQAQVTIQSTIKSITLSPQTLNIKLGSNATLSADIQPVDVVNKELIWKIEDPTIAQFTGSGLTINVDGLKLGSTTITATSPYDENIKGEATINVIGTLIITGNKSIIKVTEKLQLSASIEENAEATPTLIWTSSNPEYATVDANNGLVTGVAEGTTTITAKAVDNEAVFATFEIVVQPILLGDANDNGYVTVADVVTIADHIAEKPTYDWCEPNADVTGDSQITVADVNGTINIIMGKEPTAVRSAARKLNSINDYLVVDNFTPAYDQSLNIGVHLDNSIEYSALQAAFMIPEGMTVESVNTGSRATNHSIVYNITDDNKLIVVLYSLTNESFNANGGELLNIQVTADALCGDLRVENIHASDVNSFDYELAVAGGKNQGVATGLDSLDSFDPAVVGYAEGLKVLNAEGADIYIYSIAGEILAYEKAQSNVVMFPMGKGIYIVTVNGKTFKIKI